MGSHAMTRRSRRVTGTLRTIRLAKSFAMGWCIASATNVLTARGQETAEQLRVFQPLVGQSFDVEACPASCDQLFSKLEGWGQHVEVQERGEPKSGTGFNFEWATGALAHACVHLQRMYGQKSCRIEWVFTHRTLIFEPQLAATERGPCPCYSVDSVTITLTNTDKHTLPVDASCAWYHKRGIAEEDAAVCNPVDGGAVAMNQAELWQCATDAACPIIDNRLQLSVMRDPRAIAVSAYFHILREYPQTMRYASVDEYASAFLPAACKWLSIRYMLFSEMLGDRSLLAWYDDAQENPSEWHRRFLEFVGLRMPDEVVAVAVGDATGGGSRFGFPVKGIDRHQGGAEANPTRSFRDEISAETLENMDAVLRVWLPPAVLQHLGVALY